VCAAVTRKMTPYIGIRYTAYRMPMLGMLDKLNICAANAILRSKYSACSVVQINPVATNA
jgi:hypothetical protein